jgi:signal transduction histidine kinase
MKQKWAAKNIHFSLSTAPSKALEAYKWSLERVFHNLIDNAYKYTPNGWTISCVVNARWCIISDTWVGIASKDIQHVRKPFWQVDQSRGQDEWFGIWLALVKRLVDLHGRKVEIESELGKWTKVHLMW